MKEQTTSLREIIQEQIRNCRAMEESVSGATANILDAIAKRDEACLGEDDHIDDADQEIPRDWEKYGVIIDARNELRVEIKANLEKSLGKE